MLTAHCFTYLIIILNFLLTLLWHLPRTCSHHLMLTTRIMVSEHNFGWYLYTTSSTSPQQQQDTQPVIYSGGSGPPGSGKPKSLVYRACPIVDLLALTVEDCRAFCIEKNR